MSVLTAADRQTLRNRVEAAAAAMPAGVTKVELDAALQAIEDTFEITGRPAINTAINTATAPLVLTAAQKKALVAMWCATKVTREGF